MILQSIGRTTDLIFARFSGQVVDKGHYTLIQTPSNPGFHWGNYIIFNHPPSDESYREWRDIFDKEFPYYKEPHHYVFTWDCEQNHPGNTAEFIKQGFDLETATVLTTRSVHGPPHFNSKLDVRPLASNKDWTDAINLHVLCADVKFLNSGYFEFKSKQMAVYQSMIRAGMGERFGAFIDGKLVGDLGIFHDGTIARYQNVVTHPEYRRQGICGTLVFQAGKYALTNFGVKTLVMEADASYHAARIYESVGFKQCETNYALSWWQGTR